MQKKIGEKQRRTTGAKAGGLKLLCVATFFGFLLLQRVLLLLIPNDKKAQVHVPG